MNDNVGMIAQELGLSAKQVANTVSLLDAENTVPFIARYRKEMTGSLDEERIREIEERLRYLRNLEERKGTILKSIEEQGKLTPELADRIRNTWKLQELEDLYLPYKPKRRTRATIAKEKGLEPLARLIWEQSVLDGEPESIAAQYINPELGVLSAEDVLQGARDIVAEWIAEDASTRQKIRTLYRSRGMLSSEAKDRENPGEYTVYAEFSESLSTIPPHRILAINRGEREGVLRAWIDVPEEECVAALEAAVILKSASIFDEHLRLAVADGYQRLIEPSLQREIRKSLTEKSDGHAIQVFARNLRALLLTSPLKDRRILGIDPGFRTGCKVAAIDTTGKYLAGDTIYPHAPQNQWEESKAIVKSIIEKYEIDIIAIGNGTASRETEQFAAELLGELQRPVQYAIVSEAGASVYSASPVAKKEFPDLEASMRGNISIARRLLDPLSELVKIDPKSIGVGLYQHDVDQIKLSEALDHVVESCVNAVGVDLNTASPSLLKYVAGINGRLAEAIVAYREENGKFDSREQLRRVKGLGETAYTQASGFLRIPDSDVFFDRTAVHPESYEAAERLLQHLGLEMDSVRSEGNCVRREIQKRKLTLENLASFCGCGVETLSDIVSSLEKPNRDPRDSMDKPILRSDVLTMDDLREGMILKGTVRNVVDFGAFVDIGVKHDGLVHLSQMARRFVKNPLDIVSVGQIVEVRVLKVDPERGRIALSMVLDESKEK